jgi:transposase
MPTLMMEVGMHVEAHLSMAELKRLARAEKNVKLSKRMQMVVLAVEGYTAPAIARSLSVSRRVCQQWVQRYNAHGLQGLHDKPGRGKSPLLTPSEQEQLKQRIDAGSTEADGVCTLRGKDIQRILEEEFGKARSLGGRLLSAPSIGILVVGAASPTPPSRP